MAFGRRPYTTKFRPWVDSDDEVDLIWYNAEPDAPVLGYPSKIQQLDNVSFPWLAQGVGEVFGAPRPFNNRRAIPFLPLNHVCGMRSDFEVGGVLDPIPPDVLYDRNNIPICCMPPFLGQGGAVGSGTATVVVTPLLGAYRIQLPSSGGNIDEIFYPVGTPPHVWNPSPNPGPSMLQDPTSTGGHYWLLSIHTAGGDYVALSTPDTWDGTGTQVFTNKVFYSPPPTFGDATVTAV